MYKDYTTASLLPSLKIFIYQDPWKFSIIKFSEMSSQMREPDSFCDDPNSSGVSKWIRSLDQEIIWYLIFYQIFFLALRFWSYHASDDPNFFVWITIILISMIWSFLIQIQWSMIFCVDPCPTMSHSGIAGLRKIVSKFKYFRQRHEKVHKYQIFSYTWLGFLKHLNVNCINRSILLSGSTILSLFELKSKFWEINIGIGCAKKMCGFLCLFLFRKKYIF